MIEGRIVLRKQRDLGEIIQAAITIYMQNLWPLFTIAAIVIPISIAGAIFQETLDDPATATAVWLTLTLLQFAVGLLAGATLIFALSEIDAGRPADFSSAYDVAFERFGRLAGAYLRVLFHVTLFAITIVGIPWAIQRLVRWSFVQQAVILDDTSAQAALSYSADAVAGRWWRTLGIILAISIIVMIPTLSVYGLFALAPVVVSSIANAIVNAAALPFGVTATTLLYFDLKARRESEATAS